MPPDSKDPSLTLHVKGFDGFYRAMLSIRGTSHGPVSVRPSVTSRCSLSGRGQGHVSNFHIVDLENFATASRRSTGDIQNSTVVGLFMTPIRQMKATRMRHD